MEDGNTGNDKAMSEKQEKEYTLVFVRRTNPSSGIKEVLLGMKKRGFGAGKWNGFGGKIEPGETVEEGAVRELYEESSMVANALNRRGYLVFNMSDKLMKVHVYECVEGQYAGEPAESEEMRPRWFSETEIPFESTWADDKFWLPMLLEGKSFVGRFDYEEDDETIESYTYENLLRRRAECKSAYELSSVAWASLAHLQRAHDHQSGGQHHHKQHSPRRLARKNAQVWSSVAC